MEGGRQGQERAVVNFLLNVAANVVTGAGAVLAVYLWAWLPKRAQRRWMGMTSRKPTLQIYASNLMIKPGGAEPVEGETVTVGFTGSAMNEMEYLSALKLRDALRPSRFIEAVSELIGRPIEEPDVHVCPPWDERRAPGANLVFLGSSIYNSGTKFFLGRQDRLKFILDAPPGGPKQRVLRVGDRPFVRQPAPEGVFSDDYGLICRINQGGRSIFICAGLGAEGTCEAAVYLATRWKALRAKYGNEGFAIVVRKHPRGAKPRMSLAYEDVPDDESESSGPSREPV